MPRKSKNRAVKKIENSSVENRKQLPIEKSISKDEFKRLMELKKQMK